MKLRIPRDELKVGMFIERAVLDTSVKSSAQVDFIKDVLVDSPEKLEELKSKKIKFLLIDTAKSQKIEPEKHVISEAPVQQKPPNIEESEPEPVIEKVEEPEPEEPEHEKLLDTFDDKNEKKEPARKVLVPFEKELEIARTIKAEAVGNVKKMLQDAAVGKSFETETAKKQVNEMVKSIFRNKDALLSLTRLKSFDEYTFTHSINVTVLAIALARELGFSREQVDVIGFGAMLHDLGKMRVPESILNKPGKLTHEERMEIQKHTTKGYEILKERGDIPETAQLMTYEHHERTDGNGYPCGKTLDQLQPESILTSVVDVYDALTSARVYKPGMNPPHALTFLKARAEAEYRADYVDKFIEVIGIFPVGSVVEFNTGHIGIVNEINRDNLFRPYVILVMNSQGKKIGAGRVIGPSKYESANLKIVRYHDPGDLGIYVSDYLDAELKRI